jgi:hypothetical protein
VTSTVGLALVVACGGGGAGVDGGGGGGDGGVDAPAGTCEASATYAGPLGSAAQKAQEAGSGVTGTDAHYIEYLGSLNSDALFDQLAIELFAGFGSFEGSDIEPQTITLAGSDLQYKTCGACVRILANLDVTGETGSDGVGQYYMATGGTLDLISTRGDLDVMLTNVTLTHVTIGDDFTSTPVGDCDTSIPSLEIGAHIDQLVGSD